VSAPALTVSGLADELALRGFRVLMFGTLETDLFVSIKNGCIDVNSPRPFRPRILGKSRWT
jgi:hypothetical protein